MSTKRQRLPSDNHELTLQGPILEVENNGGYQIDDFSKKSFDEKLKEILDQVEPNKNFARNNLTLDVNNLIASGEFGDVIMGKLNAKPCHVHVISGEYHLQPDWMTINEQIVYKFVFNEIFSIVSFQMIWRW